MTITPETLENNLIRIVNALELNALNARLQKEKDAIEAVKAEIKGVYGTLFCSIVTVKKIYFLAKVEANALGLENDDKYPNNVVTPAMLNGRSAVRGVMGSLRPFIAIKIDILDSKTKEKIDVVVELVFKRYSLKGDGAQGQLMENNYVSALSVTSEKGKSWNSFLSSGEMSHKKMAAVKDLLDGKTITAPQVARYLIRMSVQ